MTSEQFIHWICGFLAGKEGMSGEEIKLLEEQLSKVKRTIPWTGHIGGYSPYVSYETTTLNDPRSTA